MKKWKEKKETKEDKNRLSKTKQERVSTTGNRRLNKLYDKEIRKWKQSQTKDKRTYAGL